MLVILKMIIVGDMNAQRGRSDYYKYLKEKWSDTWVFHPGKRSYISYLKISKAQIETQDLHLF